MIIACRSSVAVMSSRNLQLGLEDESQARLVSPCLSLRRLNCWRYVSSVILYLRSMAAFIFA